MVLVPPLKRKTMKNVTTETSWTVRGEGPVHNMQVARTCTDPPTPRSEEDGER